MWNIFKVKNKDTRTTPIFKTPHFPCPATSKIHPPPWPLTSNFKQTPPPSPNDTQSIKIKHNPRMAIISYQVFPSGRLPFSVSINSLILSGFPLTSFHLAEVNHYLLFRGFIFLISKRFLKSFLVLFLQSTCFIYITSKRKQTMEQQPHHACEWTKSNNKQKKSLHIQIDHAFCCSI